jgi:catechol 2,3-dioxygenase-like lactoylglutathione lyase family enzyme
MKSVALFIIAITSTLVVAQQGPKRPKITGIDHVDFYTTDAAANEHLYGVVLGLARTDPVEPGQTQRFMVGTQWVGYQPATDANATDRMDHIAFRTDDCEALRGYLAVKGVRVPGECGTSKDGGHSFSLRDPEQHEIEFKQEARFQRMQGQTCCPVSRRLIHTGFVVHDRAAEDRFYKDILGFHLYWYGGMKPERTDWVAMQVPDGTDWLEYMLNVKPGADLHTTGVMNHISIGVADMKAAQAKLEAHGWKPHGDEHSQMGKDGKWQLNVFDPDQTRVELMEFTPKEKPCCSEFQGKHPSENE